MSLWRFCNNSVQTGEYGTSMRINICALSYTLYTLCFLLHNNALCVDNVSTSRRIKRCRVSSLPGAQTGILFKVSLYWPISQLSVYLSSLLSLLMATMLGFLDDVFDIRWRHKLPIPIIASIPLLMVYYAERGNTHVVVPLPLRFMFGTLLNLGRSIFASSHFPGF